MTDLHFYSTAALERGLDCDKDQFENRFAAYFYALYHCAPDDLAGINKLRERLREQFPTKVISFGRRFVLMGEAAFRALTAYHHALAGAETLSEEFRAYSAEQVREITEKHRNSKSLPVPIDLTEGQLSQDFRLELLTCIAIRNRQIVTNDVSK